MSDIESNVAVAQDEAELSRMGYKQELKYVIAQVVHTQMLNFSSMKERTWSSPGALLYSSFITPLTAL